LCCGRPADAGAINAAEQRESAALPSDYVDFLQRAVGISTSQTRVFGAGDVFVTQLDAQRYWVVGTAGTGEAFMVVKVGQDGPRHLLVDHDAPIEEAAPVGDHAACVVQMALESVGPGNGAGAAQDHR